MAETKIGYGRANSIPSAVESGKIDKGDLIVTSDTNELVFIAPDGTFIRSKSRINRFDTREEAVAYAENNPAAYDGEIINIKGENGAYLLHSLIMGSTGKLEVRDQIVNSQNEITWEEL